MKNGTNNEYRVVTTERLPGGAEMPVAVFPPLSEPGLSRVAAVERIDFVLAMYAANLADYPPNGGALPRELLPEGKARMKVVGDQAARDMYRTRGGARQMSGAVR